MSRGLRIAEENSFGHSEPDSPAIRYTVVAVAPTVADLVSMAGGLLCDRAMRGWTVTAVVHDCVDARPLTILGVGISCTPTNLVGSVETIAPKILVISRGLIDSDDRRHADLVAQYDFHETQVLLCGGTRPTHPAAHYLVEHRLSPASRAFKSHALTAAGLAAGPAQDIESFVQSPAVPQFHAVAPRRDRAANRSSKGE